MGGGGRNEVYDGTDPGEAAHARRHGHDAVDLTMIRRASLGVTRQPVFSPSDQTLPGT